MLLMPGLLGVHPIVFIPKLHSSSLLTPSLSGVIKERILILTNWKVVVMEVTVSRYVHHHWYPGTSSKHNLVQVHFVYGSDKRMYYNATVQMYIC